ncbi:hypothetical protein M2277_000822 [Paenibacillus sp. LBL]|uniref:hypothetical protein n=1 Tax=Paenibacillus sp. LBL TaxID=2940563 RepID=UPI002473B582|nr:hypothetical protein [Paenibacillus sp. LBL]MDH6670178.1 hypothetical protein [Paenibacillus sp. LBL]
MNGLVKAAESAHELGMAYEELAMALSVFGDSAECNEQSIEMEIVSGTINAEDIDRHRDLEELMTKYGSPPPKL